MHNNKRQRKATREATWLNEPTAACCISNIIQQQYKYKTFYNWKNCK